ncbi:MAG TPA: GNAT family N-acetyltransferase [Polyangiaceae bacterium]
MTLREPSSFADLAVIRLLFEEYGASLGVDLSFQDFEKELASLPGDYARPQGRLWLAMMGGEAAGCVGLRLFDQESCEMKRLYVRPIHRGRGIGKHLASTAIETAKNLGYRRMYLDTLASMSGAIALYRALGFKEMAAYRFNPLPALYFQLEF